MHFLSQSGPTLPASHEEGQPRQPVRTGRSSATLFLEPAPSLYHRSARSSWAGAIPKHGPAWPQSWPLLGSSPATCWVPPAPSSPGKCVWVSSQIPPCSHLPMSQCHGILPGAHTPHPFGSLGGLDPSVDAELEHGFGQGGGVMFY